MDAGRADATGTDLAFEDERMSARDLIAAAVPLLPGLLFVEIARQQWLFRRTRQPRSRAFRLLPIVSTVLAAHYLLLTVRALIPGAQPRDPMAMVQTPWHVVSEDPWLIGMALLRHLLYLLPLPEKRPSVAWLAGNYGLAIGAAVTSAVLRLRPDATPADQELAHRVFELTFLTLGGLCFHQFVRNARPGTWRPEYAGEMRRPDVILVQVFGTAAVLSVPVVWLLGGQEFAFLAFEVLLGLAIAAPMATRMLGNVVPGLVVTAGLFVTGAVILAGYTAAITRMDAAFRPVLGVCAVALTLTAFTVGQTWLRRVATRVLLGRREREIQELQQFLHTLSPEIGVTECCRRILEELRRSRRLPGAALVFADGGSLVCGEFDVAPLERVWPHGRAAASLPGGVYGSSEQRDLPQPLRDAILEAEVGLGVAAIDSPRRRWGHLFMRTGYFGGMLREDDADAYASLLAQMALLLDAADLLARAIAVERSLAHAEKLATIGELAARFAHDIRNPVTAARSLAQQLARNPASPQNAEHATIILGELERVERQVRDLLRFARREEYRLAPVDLGSLVRATLDRLVQRLETARIDADCTTPPDVVVRGDREKLDHALVNLIENAIDAVAERPERRIRVAVERRNGTARMRVTDTGAGAPPDVLAHLFEPFYSGKPNGTGLGLAIVKRTIDGHGGRIDVAQQPGKGLTFTIELPLAAEPRP
jgi:signal transduction histidine kinase